MDSVIRVVILLILAACGSKAPYQLAEPTKKNIKQLDIKAPGVDGEIDFTKFPQQPSIVIFSEEYCKTCLEEIKTIQSEIKNNKGVPAKINLVSMLTGADFETAQNWRNLHKIKWPVGYDEEATIFKKYCSKRVFPCILIHLPEQGIVFLEQRKTELAELQQWTGLWE